MSVRRARAGFCSLLLLEQERFPRNDSYATLRSAERPGFNPPGFRP